MDFRDGLDRLELNEDEVVDDQVGAETFVDLVAVPDDGDGDFGLNVKAALAEFVGQDAVVDRFE